MRAFINLFLKTTKKGETYTSTYVEGERKERKEPLLKNNKRFIKKVKA